MKNLKQKTISGLLWSFIETSSSQLIGFVSTVILARLLFPSDFGIIGMTVIITALAQIFADSGLSQALIRKQGCTVEDYSTVFLLNIFLGLSIYILIFFFAPLISLFFKQPILTSVIRMISITIPINSFGIIQRTLLTKKINFRVQALITFIGSIFGFGIAIMLALNGYGVWSLVYRSIVSQIVMVVLLWLLNSWRPKLIFSIQSFKELFGFGSNLLLIYSLATVFKNIYNVVIGKFYTASTLGLYTNADQMSGLPSGTITTLFNKVAYPILSVIQDDNVQLKNNIRRLGKPLFLASFTLMLFLASIANSFIPLLLGEKWISSVPFFQILCIAYMAPVLHTINQLIMNIKGKSNLFLLTEIIKYIFFIPVVYCGIKFGIYVLIVGFALHYWLGFLINALFSKKLIGYSIYEQIKDLLLPLLFALIVSSVTYITSYIFTGLSLILMLILQCVIAIITGFLLLRFTNIFDYKDLILTIKGFVKNTKN
jgi:O-antigen/teichoic acid export membrane protein